LQVARRAPQLKNAPALAEALASAEQPVILGEDTPASRVGYAAVAGLVGMASGMIRHACLSKWCWCLQENEDEEIGS